MRYKGRYVAQIIIDMDVEVKSNTKPFGEVKDAVQNGLTKEIERLLRDEVVADEEGKVELIQQYADLWKVEDEDE